MANAEHVARLKHSLFAEEWNEWRQENPDIRPDLIEARLGEEDLSFADLHGAELRGASLKAARLSYADLGSADLSEANLSDAYFHGATLSGCDLKEADLSGANLSGVNLSEARLCGASLEGANLGRADFRGADLSNANLRETKAVETNFLNANLTGCRVYGISAWGLKLDGATQQDLIITPDGEPEITVDNIDVAQFVYLLLHNELTDPSSIPKELEAIVPHLAVPVQSIIQKPARPFAMFQDLFKYDWMLPPYRYESLDELLATLAEEVIAPAEAKVKALEEKRRLIEAELTKSQ